MILLVVGTKVLCFRLIAFWQNVLRRHSVLEGKSLCTWSSGKAMAQTKARGNISMDGAGKFEVLRSVFKKILRVVNPHNRRSVSYLLDQLVEEETSMLQKFYVEPHRIKLRLKTKFLPAAIREHQSFQTNIRLRHVNRELMFARSALVPRPTPHRCYGQAIAHSTFDSLDFIYWSINTLQPFILVALIPRTSSMDRLSLQYCFYLNLLRSAGFIIARHSNILELLRPFSMDTTIYHVMSLMETLPVAWLVSVHSRAEIYDLRTSSMNAAMSFTGVPTSLECQKNSTELITACCYIIPCLRSIYNEIALRHFSRQ